MKEILKIKNILKIFFVFTSLLTVFTNDNSISNDNFIRYLESTIDEIKITYDFPFSCGNGYLVMKKISDDITNELLRRNLNIVQILEGKNISQGKLAQGKDIFFNIYLVKGNSKILLATTNPESKYYTESLANYPQKFISLGGIPRDEDFSRKFNIVRILQEKIIDNM